MCFSPSASATHGTPLGSCKHDLSRGPTHKESIQGGLGVAGRLQSSPESQMQPHLRTMTVVPVIKVLSGRTHSFKSHREADVGGPLLICTSLVLGLDSHFLLKNGYPCWFAFRDQKIWNTYLGIQGPLHERCMGSESSSTNMAASAILPPCLLPLPLVNSYSFFRSQFDGHFLQEAFSDHSQGR